jgi:RHS repeat-associated protein
MGNFGKISRMGWFLQSANTQLNPAYDVGFNCVVSEIDYIWGNDISGAREGACGIGGLLYLKRNGVVYIPFYDAYGNVLGYTDAHGNVVAEYTYDPFGNIVGKSGAMSDDFAFRFSTKYYDIELDLYYYTYRYYNPQLMRWLTEDPIAEDGGLNLYGFCCNNPVCRYDKDGRAYFAKRALAGQSWSEKFSINAKLDAVEWEWSHEHLFYGTPDNPLDDVGYFGDGKVRSDEARAKSKYIVTSSGYNDCVMKKAQEQVAPKRYCVFLGALPWFDNCQSYAAKLRAKYDELLYDEKVLCECFGKRKIGGAIWLK